MTGRQMNKISLDTSKQQIPSPAVMGYMTYSFLTIKREENGHQVVGRPRVTDVIGHSLRNAYNASYGLPEDMTSLLRQLDGATSRLH